MSETENESKNETTHVEVRDFLYDEAQLLDDGQLNEWFENVVTEDIQYQIPVRLTKEGGKDEFDHMGAHLDEDYSKLKERINRFDTEYAWAEQPPSRTRHIISNIRIPTEDDDEIEVKSNFLLYRNRGDNPEYDLLAGERHDTLQKTDEGFKLKERVVLLDQSALASHNISFII